MTSLVALSREHCPDCNADLTLYQTDQPALFKHAGYGATDRVVLGLCPACGYSRQRERSEISPRSKPTP